MYVAFAFDSSLIKVPYAREAQGYYSGLNIMCAHHMSRQDLKALINTALTTFTGRLFLQTLTTRIYLSGGKYLFLSL